MGQLEPSFYDNITGSCDQGKFMLLNEKQDMGIGELQYTDRVVRRHAPHKLM